MAGVVAFVLAPVDFDLELLLSSSSLFVAALSSLLASSELASSESAFVVVFGLAFGVVGAGVSVAGAGVLPAGLLFGLPMKFAPLPSFSRASTSWVVVAESTVIGAAWS